MALTSPSAQPIVYTLRPIRLSMHELEVEMAIPPGALEEGGVAALPAWTPGSYLVRDYARFLDRLRAVDGTGKDLPCEKIDKQRWRLGATKEGVTLTYRLFCNELTVRTNHVDATHAHLAGAATFLYLEDRTGPSVARFQDWPPHWGVASSLPRGEDGFRAEDHDALVDSPFELGTFRMHAFNLRGCQFQMAITGRHPGNEERIVKATEAIVKVCGDLFGGFPFDRYLFLLSFSPRNRGGLEHRDCASLLADPQQLEKTEGYWDLFLFIAHEFFHVWNVKRMRDAVLGPFDYRGENHSRLLWFHEGFTSFMQYAIVLRAGVAPWSWVARKLGSSWTDNTLRPGRLEQTLEEASFDAWIRHYKPTEFATNSTVSYYEKGAMVAWMLDAEMRLATAGTKGLDAFFALLWERHGDAHLADEDLRRACRDLTGRDEGPFWSDHIRGTAELDATGIQKAYGLAFTAKAPWETLPGTEAEDPEAFRRARVHAGLTFQGQAPVIQNVLPGSPGALAGLGYGMEVLAVDGWRASSAQEVQNRLGDAGPGDAVQVLATDRGRVGTYVLTLVENPLRTTVIAKVPRPTPAQKEAFLAWTGTSHGGRRA